MAASDSRRRRICSVCSDTWRRSAATQPRVTKTTAMSIRADATIRGVVNQEGVSMTATSAGVRSSRRKARGTRDSSSRSMQMPVTRNLLPARQAGES